jgi:5'-nucleotidase
MSQEKPLKLLISNDDGIFALGIRTLANTLAEAGHQITIVCPNRERSATGHGLTLHQPIRVEMVKDVFHPNIVAWSCSGTPADCVKFALSVKSVLEYRPDFVLAGINHGSNLGTDILYSGTVSAAMEGLFYGIPSLAVSLASYTDRQFQNAADFMTTFLTKIAYSPFPEATLLNINVPAVKEEKIAGIQLTRQGLRRYIETFEKRFDPHGKCYYWLVGENIEDLEQPNHIHLPAHILTDVQAIQENYISITPLQYNLTDVQSFEYLNQTGWFHT